MLQGTTPGLLHCMWNLGFQCQSTVSHSAPGEQHVLIPIQVSAPTEGGSTWEFGHPNGSAVPFPHCPQHRSPLRTLPSQSWHCTNSAKAPQQNHPSKQNPTQPPPRLTVWLKSHHYLKLKKNRNTETFKMNLKDLKLFNEVPIPPKHPSTGRQDGISNYNMQETWEKS